MDTVKLYAAIEKVDEEKKMVYGYATTEALDSQGEIVSKDAITSALDDYMKFANIREMHQPSAVGKAKEAKLDEKGLYIAVKVVDSQAWEKVKEGVYNGFSIGGQVQKMDDNVITSLLLKEISLVDRPANPEAVFDVWKRDDKKDAKKVDSKKADEQEVKVQTDVPDGTTEEVVIADESKVEPEKKEEPVVESEARAVPEKEEVVEDEEVEVKEEKGAKPPKGKKMDKDVYGAYSLVNLACNLHSFIVSERYEGEDTAELEGALEAIKNGVSLELAEGESYPTEVWAAVELAEKTLNLAKENKSDEEKTSDFIKALEDKARQGTMPTDAEVDQLLDVTETEKTDQNRGIVKHQYAGKIFHYLEESIKNPQIVTKGDDGEDEEGDEATGDEKVEETKTGDDVEKAGRAISSKNKDKIQATIDSLTSGLASLLELIDAAGDGEKSEIPQSKVGADEQAQLAKVGPQIVELKELLAKVSNLPAAVKIKASYTTIEKGEATDAEKSQSELAKAEARVDELALKMKSDPQNQVLQKEAQDLSSEILRLRREVRGASDK